MITKNWDESKVDVLDLSIKLRSMNVQTLFVQVMHVDYEQQDTYRLHVSLSILIYIYGL